MKRYLIITSVIILFSSCLKQSIPDAMLGISGKQGKNTATMSYEINGNLVTISVDDADNQIFHTLECVKSSDYVLSGISSSYGEFVLNFFTDSLKVGNYDYPSNAGPIYVTNFLGSPLYVYYPTDNLNLNVTIYKDGRISGNFSGQFTPKPNDIWGDPSSVSVTNGSFDNVPVVY